MSIDGAFYVLYKLVGLFGFVSRSFIRKIDMNVDVRLCPVQDYIEREINSMEQVVGSIAFIESFNEFDEFEFSEVTHQIINENKFCINQHYVLLARLLKKDYEYVLNHFKSLIVEIITTRNHFLEILPDGVIPSIGKGAAIRSAIRFNAKLNIYRHYIQLLEEVVQTRT